MPPNDISLALHTKAPILSPIQDKTPTHPLKPPEITMSDASFDPTKILENYRSVFAPALKTQQEGLKALDRVGRYQYAVAGDYLD